MALPDQMNNPFWTPEQDEVPFAAVPYSSWSGPQASVGIDMITKGLGTIAARSRTTGTLEFIVRSDESNPTLKLTVTRNNCELVMKEKNADDFKKIPVIDHLTDPGTSDKVKPPFAYYPKQLESACLNIPKVNDPSKKVIYDPTVYWISIDRSNKRFRYGQHLTNASLTYLEAYLKDEDELPKKWMNKLASTEVRQDGDQVPSSDVKYDPLPVTMDKPPLVVSDEQISLEHLDKYTRTTYANLPAGCQTLYHNVAGHNVTLESAGFPQLAEAIDYSCRNESLVCGKILKKKMVAKEFGSDLETYLRITVGNNLANSPGIPYVMEIWPPGHMSPIHDHGRASAVIKVLYGSLDCSWYDAVQTQRPPKQIGKSVKLSKGDVTWLGDKQYQIHKLQNNYKTVCITLQCYQFEASDKEHYEYFDYLDKHLDRKAFIPNSDKSYSKLVEDLKVEWYTKHGA